MQGNIKMKKNEKIMLITFLLVVACLIGGGTYLIKTATEPDYPDYVKYTKVNKKFFNSMTDKELIYYKVINSIDFYKNASGSYETGDTRDNSLDKVKYYADIEGEKSYMIGDDNTETLVKDGKSFWIDNVNKSIKENKVESKNDKNIPKLRVKDRIDRDGVLISRNDGAFLGMVDQTLFNQYEIAGELAYMDNWSIAGEIIYLDRQAVKITGKWSCESNDGTRGYSVIVDKATGIILEYDYLDSEGKILHSLKTTDIQIDKGIPKNIFNKDLSGYKKK